MVKTGSKGLLVGCLLTLLVSCNSDGTQDNMGPWIVKWEQTVEVNKQPVIIKGWTVPLHIEKEKALTIIDDFRERHPEAKWWVGKAQTNQLP